MVRELNMDTQRKNFWKESIHKEATVRLAWQMKFSKSTEDDDASPLCMLKSRNSVPEKNCIDNNDEKCNGKLPPINKKSPNKKLRHKPKDFCEPGELSSQQPLMVEMRPVTAGTRKLLYKGFSALGEGRYAYLQKRKQDKPEEKYEFPMTSGWEYGWKITESAKRTTSKPAEFGRTRIVRDSFYRRNGVIPQAIEVSSFQ